MAEFKYKHSKFSHKDIDPQDTGVFVKNALNLIKESSYYDEIYNALGVGEIINDFINIPGAQRLIKSVDIESKKYYKVDIEKQFQDLKFLNSEDESKINISFPASENYPISFIASPIYSAQSDFLGFSCNMNKYASKLIKNDRIDLVLSNLESIRSLYNEDKEKHEYNYRILKDENGNHFYRAITSKTHYKDYNIGVSVFVALVALHKYMKESGIKMILNNCEYSESYIRVYFEKLGRRKIKIGEVKYLIEMNNSEVKEGPVRFSGVCAILTKDEKSDRDAVKESKAVIGSEDGYDDFIEGGERELFIKPRPSELKYSIQSINHNESPGKAISKMILSTNIESNENKIYEDLASIGEGRSLAMIRTSILDKLTRIQKESDLGEFKASLQKAVPEAINNYHELLRLLNRLDLIASDSIEAKEQLRYLFYEALLEKRSNGINKERDQDEV